eukprot:CFRG0833T1
MKEVKGIKRLLSAIYGQGDAVVRNDYALKTLCLHTIHLPCHITYFCSSKMSSTKEYIGFGNLPNQAA